VKCLLIAGAGKFSAVKKNGRLGEGVSLNLRKTVNKRATLYLAKIKNITLVDGVIKKN
jgi:hypothetical protein